MGTKRGPVKGRKYPEPSGRSRNIWVPGIAARISELRKTRSQVPNKELGLLDLSKLVGAPYSNVKQWFYEEKIGSAEAVKLARWAEVSLDWLLAGIPEGPERGLGAPGASNPERSPDGATPVGGAQIASPGIVLLEAALPVLATAVAAAIRRAIDSDLLENTQKARQHLADSLHKFGLELQRGGVDATELFDVVQQIREGRLLK